MRKLALLVLLIATSLQAAGYPVYRTLRENVYKIDYGTAFQVEWKGKTYMVTNWHVCRNFKESDAKNDLRNFVGRTKVLSSDPGKDLCIMSPVWTSGIRIAKDPRKGDAVYTGGYPTSFNKLHLSSGYVQERHDITMDMDPNPNGCPHVFKRTKIVHGKVVEECKGTFNVFDSDLYGWYGASGSPVINSHGELIGVVDHAIGTNGPAKDGKAGFLPVSSLVEMLDSLEP